MKSKVFSMHSIKPYLLNIIGKIENSPILLWLPLYTVILIINYKFFNSYYYNDLWELLKVLISIHSVIIGFLWVVWAILIDSDTKIEYLKSFSLWESNLYEILFSYLRFSLFLTFIILVSNIVLFIFSELLYKYSLHIFLYNFLVFIYFFRFIYAFVSVETNK
jgi:hypothetical protein